MCAAAGFHANLDAWFYVLLDLLNPATTLQTLAPNRALSTIDAVQLKDVLRKIHPNPSKLHLTSPHSLTGIHATPVWHSMP
jgi:hypothetical protein